MQIDKCPWKDIIGPQGFLILSDDDEKNSNVHTNHTFTCIFICDMIEIIEKYRSFLCRTKRAKRIFIPHENKLRGGGVNKNHLVRPYVMSGLYLSDGETLEVFLLYINITHYLTKRHDLNPRSFGQSKGHWQEKCKICFRSTLEFLTSHKDCLWPEGV